MSRLIISLGWWNCGLAPASGKSPKESSVVIARAILKMLVKEIGIEIIGLCELNQQLLDALRIELEGTSYEVSTYFDKAGKSEFDTCLIYNKEVVNVKFIKNILMIKGTRTYKIAQSIEIGIENKQKFSLLLSHWPSRLHIQQENSLRLLFGNKLREEIDDIMRVSKENYIVLMGDYNDEPFDISLTQGLMASRDRIHAKKKDHILYNPFWRFLAFSDFAIEDTNKFVCDGSYYFKNGDITKWHTFDQMIFSNRFLNKEGIMFLKEEFTNIIISDNILDLMHKPDSCLDHLPIRCAIEMEV